jgi:hypothetical protein
MKDLPQKAEEFARKLVEDTPKEIKPFTDEMVRLALARAFMEGAMAMAIRVDDKIKLLKV